MIMKLLFSTLALLLLSGCGGGTGDEEKAAPAPLTRADGKYNLWEYMVPRDATLHTFSHIQGANTQSYTTSYTVTANKVIEIANYAKDEKTIYEKQGNEILVSFEKNNQANGLYKLFLTADVGENITVRSSTCKLSKHYDTFTLPNSTKSFQDVIEITCNQIPGYYQKGVGEIAQIQESANGKDIRVLSH